MRQSIRHEEKKKKKIEEKTGGKCACKQGNEQHHIYFNKRKISHLISAIENLPCTPPEMLFRWLAMLNDQDRAK